MSKKSTFMNKKSIMSKKSISVFLLLSFFILIIGAVSISLFVTKESNQTTSTQAQTYPAGFKQVVVVNGLSQPTSMEIAPDGRIFVAEKGGALRVVNNGALVQNPFLTVPVKKDGERGLLGVTVDPDYATNRFVYIYYTDDSRSVNRLVRYTADGSNPNVAMGGSETVIMDNIPSQAGYHNGGALHFGTDGKLYVAVGESHASSNSQSMQTIAGKILRINKDGTIPTDNPFYTSASDVNRAIWALGFRNPFTFAINPTNGKLFVNDVGGGGYEEINDVQRGSNYGWPTCEGSCTRGFANPVYYYGHDVGKAITGGVFYTGQLYPAEYRGNYFFADYLGNWIKVLNTTNNQVTTFVEGLKNPVDLRVGKDGLLYYLSYGSGTVYRIEYGNGAPVPTTSSVSVAPGDLPSATIIKPVTGTIYSAGDTISYEGSATDSKDGVLPESAFRWRVETVHNDDHSHPFQDWVSGSKTGSFKTGIVGENAANIKYRIYLEVKNSRNQTAQVTMDVLPKNVTMQFESDPSGLELMIDGQPQKTPFSVTGVAGFQRSIGAPVTQVMGNKGYLFVSWSDGGVAEHTILTPGTATTFKATYRETVLSPSNNCLGGGCIVPSFVGGNQISGQPSVTPVVDPGTGEPGGNVGFIQMILEFFRRLLELLISLLQGR